VIFLDNFIHMVQDNELFPPQALIVLAVSGGADSLALLHACATQQVRLGCTFHVATLDHQLRPESASDVAFVQQMAQTLGLPCTTGQADVQAYLDAHGAGLEDAARRARYDFLAGVAQSLDTSYVATAHHADDQAETVLMRLLRGAGLTGLSGMNPRSPMPYHPQITLLRPLLSVRREAIENYCEAHQLEPRQDASNSDTAFFRNAVRHEILPYLRGYNPQIDDSLLRLADILAVDEAYLMQQFENRVRPQMQFGDRVTLPLAAFRGWHPSMQRRALRMAALHCGSEPGYEHLTAACEMARTGQVGQEAQFPGEVRLRVGYELLYVEPESLPLPTGDYWLLPDAASVIEVNLPGKTVVNGWQLTATRANENEMQAPVAYLNVPENVAAVLRTRQPGDRFAPLGMGGQTRSLKKWLIDKKIPQHVRDRLPLLLLDDTLAAVILPGEWAVSEMFAVFETSQRILHFKVRKLL
jgi:tRNA(Ile)-lysidine synthase